jgi:ribosomal protein L29
MKSIKELRSLPENELLKRKEELSKELVKFRGQAGGSSSESSGSVKRNKRNIARIITLIKEKKEEVQ